MLDQLRRNSRSWLIWFIFAILIAAFVLFFGPQSGPEMFGCAGSASTVVEVDGHSVQIRSWRYAMNSLGGTGGSGAAAAQRRTTALDKLVERQIFASEAERMGMKISDDMIREKIKVGEVYLLGQKIDARNVYFRDGVFEYRSLELWVRNRLGLSSVDAFIGEQKREVLANMTRDVLIASSASSLEEARSDYIDANTQVTVDYVSFPVGRYASAIKLSEADAARFAETSDAAVKAAWETEKSQFATEKTRVLTRMLTFNKDPADIKPDGEPELEPSSDSAKTKAVAALARITGGADFATVAAEDSDDGRTKNRGGLLGWRAADTLGYGTVVVDAVKKLELGQVSEIIEGPRGYHVVKLIERAEGALTYEQRKPDIAYRLAADYYAEKLAARDASLALASLDGKSLDESFERKVSAPSFSPGGPGNQFTPEQMKQLQEQLQRSLEEQKKNLPPGATPGGDAPAPAPAPAPTGDTPAPTGDTPAPTGDAPTPAAPEGDTPTPAAPEGDTPAPAADKQGWIFREGETQLAQAGGAATESKPPSPTPAAANEVLPTVSLPAPQVEKLGPTSRPPDKLAGLGRSKELIRDLFENLKEGETATRVYSVTEPDGLVIVQLLDRTEADLERFTEEKNSSLDQGAMEKAISVVHHFATRRCRELAEAGEIGVNKAYLVVDSDKPPIGYTACASLSVRDVLYQIGSRYPALGYGQ